MTTLEHEHGPLQHQLFRYAQDLQELMAQQAKLQRRHQTVLQFMGRGEQDDDLLLNTMLRSYAQYLVTNAQGEILHASPALELALQTLGGGLQWLSIQNLTPQEESAGVRALLGKLSGQEATLAIQQCGVALLDQSSVGHAHAYSALVMRGGNAERTEIYWLLNPCDASGTCTEIAKTFPLGDDSTQALMVTDRDCNICAVNPAFTRITGYAESEVLGRNPRILSSGLQEADFYQEFWREIQTRGGWTGELFNRRKSGQVYFEWVTIKSVQDAAGNTVAYMAIFSDMSRREETPLLTPLAFHDPLTGLPNRRLLEDRLVQAMEEARCKRTVLGVLYLGIKYLNSEGDALGQGVNDRVVQEVSRRLQTAVRPGDVVARVGTDAFVLLLPNVDDDATLAGMVSFLLYLMDAPIHTGDATVHVSVGIGVSRYPKDGTDKAALLGRAESAMAQAKQRTSCYCFWAES